MSIVHRLLPHPAITVLLAVVWLLLQQSLSVGHFLLGTVLGVFVPMFTRRFWPERVRMQRPLIIARFCSLVVWDILIANFSVAMLALGPMSAIRPGFVRMPVELNNDFALTVLASTISLTPGTVSAELDAGRRYLLIHYLTCDDEAELMRLIKQRYEAPLKEIFAC